MKKCCLFKKLAGKKNWALYLRIYSKKKYEINRNYQKQFFTIMKIFFLHLSVGKAAIFIKNDEICGNLDSFNQERASKKDYSHAVIET